MRVLGLAADGSFAVLETDGRTIERSVKLPVDTREARVGIKSLFPSGQIGEDETAGFEALLIDAAGKAQSSAPLKWEIVRLNQRWQWYSRDGQWNYEAVTTARRHPARPAATSRA